MTRTALIALSIGMVAGTANAAVVLTVSDQTRDGDNGSGTRTLTTTLGSVSAPPAVPTTTYTVSGLDLTSVGGGASETIAFDITYSQTGGTGVQFNGFGNVSVTGGEDNQIDLGETLTATVSLNNGLSTFSGLISLGIVQINAGGTTSDETWNVIHDGGTIPATTANNPTSFAASSFVTLETTDGQQQFDRINLQAFHVEITADSVVIPTPAAWPAATALLTALAVRRRRR